MKKIGLIFDMDGVVVDSEHVGASELMRHASQFGVSLSRDDIRKYKGQTGIKIWQRLVEEFSLPSPAEYYLAAYNPQAFLPYSKLPPTPGIEKLLQECRQNHVPTSIATSARRDRMNAMMGFLNLTGCFDAYICGSDVQNSKPHPEVFLKAAAAIGCEPSQCIVFEDATLGIEAALAGGFCCVGVRNTENTAEEVAKAHHIIENFLDFTVEKAVQYLQER